MPIVGYLCIGEIRRETSGVRFGKVECDGRGSKGTRI